MVCQLKKLEILLEWLLPCYQIPEGNGVWIIDETTELLSVITVCQHEMHNGFRQ